MKLGAYVRKQIEQYYTDTFDAYRYGPVLNDDGTETQRLASDPHIIDQPCRVSFVPNRQEDPKDSEVDANPIIAQPKIFAAPDIDLCAGDYVHLKRKMDDGEVIIVYTGPVGLPYLYPSHLEVLCGEVEKA